MSPIHVYSSLRSLSLTSPLDNLYLLVKTYYAPKAPPRDTNKKQMHEIKLLRRTTNDVGIARIKTDLRLIRRS